MKLKDNILIRSHTDKTIEIAIPFSGFYGSVHESVIDRNVESEIEYLEEEMKVSKKRLEELKNGDGFNYRKMFENYTVEYVKAYFDYLKNHFDEDGIDIRYDENSIVLQSPREYNFATDRIFVKVNKKDLLKLFKLTNKELLEKVIKENFTSYDGFCSFYSNSLEEWGNPKDWDHNQWHTVLKCWLTDDKEFWYDIECPVELYPEKLNDLEIGIPK